MTTRPAPAGSVDDMSYDKHQGGRWPRTAVLAITAGIVVLVAGCGSTPSNSSSSGESSTVEAEVAYQQCMSSHGVQGVTVNSSGDVSMSSSSNSGGQRQQAGGLTPAVQSAMTACQHLLPGGQLTQAELRKLLPQGLKYAACMRTHGVPNFPDPSLNDTTQIGGPGSGIDPESAQFQKAQQSCRSLKPTLPSATGAGSS
jgi:hypothetical protein